MMFTFWYGVNHSASYICYADNWEHALPQFKAHFDVLKCGGCLSGTWDFYLDDVSNNLAVGSGDVLNIDSFYPDSLYFSNIERLGAVS